MPLIALEILLSFGVLTWAVWELVSLRREQRRDREKAALEQAAVLAAAHAAAAEGAAVPPGAAPVPAPDPDANARSGRPLGPA